MLAPQQGHQSQGCIVNFNGPFASLLCSSSDHACHFDVESWDLQYGAQNRTPQFFLLLRNSHGGFTTRLSLIDMFLPVHRFIWINVNQYPWEWLQYSIGRWKTGIWAKNSTCPLSSRYLRTLTAALQLSRQSWVCVCKLVGLFGLL